MRPASSNAFFISSVYAIRMTIELQQLRQVVALAEHRSFVRAATALHISQPALSRSIQNLELRFGSRLFLRSTSGVVPTDLGHLYIERARDVLRMTDALQGEAISHAGLRTGQVDIGGGPFPLDSFLGHATAQFVEQYPRMSVRLHSGNWDDLVRQLRSRTLDFFVAETSLLSREPDLDIIPLTTRHTAYFVARTGHPLARAGAPCRAADILTYPFVAPSRIPPRVLEPMLAAHREASLRVGSTRPLPAIECYGLGPVKRIVASSNVVTATILACIANELDEGTFEVLGTEPWMHMQYGVVSLRDRPLTQAAETLRELVVQAEREAVILSQRLLERHSPEQRRRRGETGLKTQPAPRLPAQSTGRPAAKRGGVRHK